MKHRRARITGPPGGRSSFARLVRSELLAAADLIEPRHGLPELRARLLATGPGAPMISTSEMTFHRCPGPGCRAQVPDKYLACPPHWAMVPGVVQQAVYAALRDYGLGSAQLRAAHRAAIDHMSDLEDPTHA